MSIPNPYPNIADKEINDAKTWSSAKIIDELQPALDTELTCEETYEGNIVTFNNLTNKEITSLECEILPIQEGSGTPSPSNPRPISGTSVLNVEQRGLNIFDKKPFSDWVTKSLYIVLNANLPKNELLTMVFIDKDTSIDISGCYLGFVKDTYNGGTVQNEDYHWTLQNGTVRGRTDNVAEVGTDLCNYLMMYPTNEATYNKIFSRFDIMVVVGASTATDFEPYNAETYTFDLGQETMGGSADVVGGTGEETHGIVDLGDLTWTYRTDVLSVPCFLSSDISDIKSGTLPLACSCFKIMSPNRTAIDGNYQVSIGNNTDAKYLVIRYDEYTDGTAVKTALIGQKLVYELATPTDFTFTGQPINSLLGVNNVWTDSGNIKVTTTKTETIGNILKERGILP